MVRWNVWNMDTNPFNGMQVERCAMRFGIVQGVQGRVEGIPEDASAGGQYHNGMGHADWERAGPRIP